MNLKQGTSFKTKNNEYRILKVDVYFVTYNIYGKGKVISKKEPISVFVHKFRNELKQQMKTEKQQ